MSFAEFEDCFIWSCNSCGYEVVFPPHDFWGCVAELKARSWGFDRDEGDWTHTCGRCRHKHQQTNIMDRTFKTVK
jgi:hypothetical protein